MPPPAATFVGRVEELRAVSAALAEAKAGAGRVIVVSGEGGIGKTRLCEEVAASARARAIGVAWSSCWEAGSLPPLWPWVQLLDQLGVAFDTPSDVETAPDVARSRQLSSLLQALRTAAAGGPRLLVIDDAQWADVATLRLLIHLAPLVRSLPVVVVASAREPAPGAVLPPDLVRQSAVVPVPALTVEEVGALAGQLTGAELRPGMGTELHRATGGNPLFATELVRVLVRAGGLAQLAPGTGFSVPPTVRAVLDERLGQLSPSCREVLMVAAVSGTEFSSALLADAAGESVRGILEALSEAARSGVVVEVGPARYRFGHPLFRSVLYDDVGIARRTELHARVGVALESVADPLGGSERARLAALSHHFLAAAPAGTAAKAAHYAERAAEAAWAALAYEESARLFERALEADELALGAADRVRLLLGQGRALAAAGRGAAARDAFIAAGTRAQSEQRLDQFAEAALGLAGSGFEVELFDHDQVEMLEKAHALRVDNPALRARVAARLSVALSLSGDDTRRSRLSEAAVELADGSGDSLARCQALAARCDTHAGPAHRDQRERDATEIIRLARDRGDQGTELLGRRLLVVAALEAGDLVAVDREVDAFARVADVLRQPQYQWYAELWRALRAIVRGDVARYQTHTAEAERLGAGAGSVNWEILVMAQHWFASLELGDAPGACAELDLRIPHGRYAEMGPQMLPAEVGRRLYAGRIVEARAVFDVGIEAVMTAPHDAEWLTMVAQVADLAVRLRADRWLSPLYDTLAPFADLWSVDGIGAYAHGPVHRQLGALATLLGRAEDASAHFDAALAGNERAGADLLAARTQYDRAVATGDRDVWLDARDRYATLGIDARVNEIDRVVGPRRAPAPGKGSFAVATFRPDGDVWELVYAGRSVRVRDAKGVRDLARLLAEPGREVPVLDLVSADAPHGGDLGPAVDATARKSYKERLVKIEAELDDADVTGDAERSARLTAEREALVAQLSAAYGLGGRPRRVGDPAERARSTVTARVRDSIRRISAAHPELGRHLARSVRTGMFCSYEPEEPIRWATAHIVRSDLTPPG